MLAYSIKDYNFENDDLFQKFFKSKLPNEYISRDKFIRKLNSCKREWVDILNSPILRLNYGIPMDWGYEEK